jgi:transposase-like protein
MNETKSLYHGYRFPPEIISHAVWLYHRFCLSFRDAEDLLAERGTVVSYETIRSWCNTTVQHTLERSRNVVVHLATHGTWMKFTSWRFEANGDTCDSTQNQLLI